MNIRKIIASITLSVFTFFVLMPSIFGVVRATSYIGDETWFSPSFAHFVVKIWESDDDEIYGERYTYAQTHWIIWSITSWLMPDNLERCAVGIALAQESWTNISEISECEPLLQGGLGTDTTYPESQPFASVIYQEMISNPMSGVGYISKKASDLGLVQEVYAQEGFGFSQLEPIQKLWQGVRNMTYFFLVIVAIVLAFMIMFRTKTSPQTVISVQSAIPKLVIALILITFSYAIAGFLVDLAYVLLGIFAIILTLPGMDIVDGMGTTQLFTEFLSGGAISSLYAALSIYLLLFLLLGAIVGLAALGISGGGFAPILFGSAVIAGLLMIIFGIFFIVVYFRILWLLLKTFIHVVLLTIVGPIYILIGTMPGAGGVVTWIRSLAAQLVIFPMVIIMLFLAHFFFWGLRTTTVIGDIIGQFDDFNPYNIITADNLSGTIGLPGFHMSTGLMGFLGAFAIMALTPHAANIVKSLIERQPFGYGSAIGQGFGFVGAGSRPVANTGLEYATEGFESRFGKTSLLSKTVRQASNMAQKRISG